MAEWVVKRVSATKISGSSPAAVDIFLHKNFFPFIFSKRHVSRGNFWWKNRICYPKNSYSMLNQFCAPRFKEFLKKAFKLADILEEGILECQTPMQYCFGEMEEHCIRQNCEEISFLKCTHCEFTLCFSCFYERIMSILIINSSFECL